MTTEAITQEQIQAVMLDMAEPEPGPRRDKLAEHLKKGGGIKCRKTEKGRREEARLVHLNEHAECDEKCHEAAALKKTADELTGPCLEYEFALGTRQDSLAYAVAGFKSLESKGYVKVGFESRDSLPALDRFPLLPTETGKKQLRELLAQGWKPNEEHVRSLIDFFFGKDQKLVDDIVLLIMNEDVASVLGGQA